LLGSLGLTELIFIVLVFITLAAIISLLLPKQSSEPDFPLRQRLAFVEPEHTPAPPHTEPSGGRMKGPEEKYCQECGSVIRAKAEICPKCGVRQAMGSLSGRNRLAAALFALLLGGIGIHKFYLGKVGQGVLYLLFCWTFIPLIISIIEGIVYLTMTDSDFAAKYG
jgi:hypothetical protein